MHTSCHDHDYAWVFFSSPLFLIIDLGIMMILVIVTMETVLWQLIICVVVKNGVVDHNDTVLLFSLLGLFWEKIPWTVMIPMTTQ